MNRIAKNYIYNLCYQIMIMILPVITTPYISRHLGAEGVGAYNYSYAIISVVIIVASLGTNMYGQREIAYVQNDILKRSIVFWNIFVIRLCTSVIVLPGYLLISMKLTQYMDLLILMMIFLIANIVDISWFFQGMEEFKKTAIRSMAVKLISTILVFVVVKTINDINMYVVILAGAQLIGNVILWGYLPQRVKIVSISDIMPQKYIRSILELFLPTAAIYIYTFIDKIFLGAFTNDLQVGYYSQSEKIIKLIMTVVTSLGAVLLPNIATLFAKNKFDFIRNRLYFSLRYVVFIGMPLVFGIILVAERFIPVFLGFDFTESILLFKLFAPLIMIIGIASVIGQSVLIPLQKQKAYSVSILIGALSNILCNFLFVPRFLAVGAAIGTVVAELVVTSIQSIVVIKTLYISIGKLIKQSLKYVFASVIMFALGKIMDSYLNDSLISLCIIVIGSCFSYFVLLFFMKDDFLKNYIKLI